MTTICQSCKKPFERSPGRGRPAVRCPSCRGNATSTSVSSSSSEVFDMDDDKPSLPKHLTEEDKKEETTTPASTNTPAIVSPVPVSKVRVANGETYCLMVGNLGMAYGGENENEAIKQFTHYSKASTLGFGQVGFECVQLWKLNGKEYELYKDFKPPSRDYQ